MAYFTYCLHVVEYSFNEISFWTKLGSKICSGIDDTAGRYEIQRLISTANEMHCLVDSR